jgi:RNA polymerase subunit RPABC4/transcription elongation factor Spt4
MSNQDDFVERIKSSWRYRANEHATLSTELRVIPAVLKSILWALSIAGLVVAGLASVFAPEVLPRPLVAEPLAIRVLAMVGIAGAAAIVGSLSVMFYGYIWADAKRRGMSPVMWLVVALLVPYLIGAILYFIVREPLPLTCPQCGNAVNAHFNFCPACQFNLRPACPQCRRGIGAGARFCPHCGFTLRSNAEEQEVAPTA